MIDLIVLEKFLKLEYFALWKLWEDLNIDWTTLDNIHERLAAKHYQHDIEFRFWDFNNGNFEGVYSFICDCVDAIFIPTDIKRKIDDELTFIFQGTFCALYVIGYRDDSLKAWFRANPAIEAKHNQKLQDLAI